MHEEVKRIFITVKAYPNPSRKYGETVCVAGIDIDTNKWIRLYPIPFRDLDKGQKFKKYSVIQVRANKANDDKRPESYRVDANSIKILHCLDTKGGWNERKKLVLPTVEKSMCAILKKSEKEDMSLGVFKPHDIDFIWLKAKPKDDKTRKSCYAQLSFFNKRKAVIEKIPFDFRYRFQCYNEPHCTSHDYSIIDWEIGQAYRDWRMKYSSQNLLFEKIKERWLTRMCSPKNDVYFFVGNMKRFRDKFMILGVFYPPKVSQ